MPSRRRTRLVSKSSRGGARSAYRPTTDWISLRRHHLLRPPLPEQGAQRGRLQRLVQHRDLLVARGGLHGGAAIGGDQDRGDGVAEAAAKVADGGDAVAAAEV